MPAIHQILDVGEGRELILRISKDPVEEIEDFIAVNQDDQTEP